MLAREAGEMYFKDKKNATEIDTVPELVDYILSREDYSGFYWSKAALNTISNKYFANWHELKDKLKIAKVFKKGGKDDTEEVKIPDAIELQPFFEVLDAIPDWKTSLFKPSFQEDEAKKPLLEKATNAHMALLSMVVADINDHAQSFIAKSGKVADMTKEYFAKSSGKAKEKTKKEWKEAIKDWMDDALAVNRMLKYFWVRENKVKGTPMDATLSEALRVVLNGKNDEATWFKWYDGLRNFLTKKPQDDAKENKLKLNFENGSLLGGWSDGQEKSKAAVLLRKEGVYYLGILKKKNIFDTEKENNLMYQNTTAQSGRLILANLAFKTLSGKGFKGEFQEKYADMGKRDPQEAIRCLQKIIRDRYATEYPLLEKIGSVAYSDKKKFDSDIQVVLKDSYVCRFRDIDWSEVDRRTTAGDMYLFQISSKDFPSAVTKKNRDLQTMYWESLFIDGTPHQLNGGGEIFYRKQAIKEKRVKAGYENKPWVIESKRFADEYGKFSFHCPIKLNYKEKGLSQPQFAFPFVNKFINEQLPDRKDLYFLGIDRGEKHLAYYALVDVVGNLVDGGTLNMPFTDQNGKPRTIKAIRRTLKDGKEHEEEVECKDYNDLLDAKAGNRDYARKNWQTIGTIKELKDGYISQVVHKVATLATADKPTFVVLEDLNVGFMRGRQKIEKSIYKKLEVAIAKKMNFLVDKSKDGKYGDLGSVTQAVQLTPPVKNFDELKKSKQAGVMLFVRPDYTSQTDPVTGWRKKTYISGGSEDAIKRKIIETFTGIDFDGKDYVFTYKDDVTGKEWKVYSGKDGESLDRFWSVRDDKGIWNAAKQDLPGMLDALFVEFDKSRSFLMQINEGKPLTKIGKHTAWESLRFIITLILQIRNTGKNERDKDFIQSPVRDEKGNHFDSRLYWDKQKRGESVTLPSSGDANGAYNIARKGIIVNEHIRCGLKLDIRDEEWDAWLAGIDIWKVWLEKNKKDLQKPTKEKP